MFINVVQIQPVRFLLLLSIAVFFIFSSQVKANSQTEITLCDKLAASPSDPMAITSGVEFNKIGIDNALAACKEAVQNDYDSARLQFQLGRVFHAKKYYINALKAYLIAANHNYVAAENNIGFLYESGQGVPQDNEKASKWYLKAAEQGFVMAQNNLGRIYQIDKDYAKAAKWYRKAAIQGNVTAQKRLGTFYYIGQGVPKDYSKAAMWFLKAAKQGEVEAQSYIAELYFNGQGVSKNYSQAAKWNRKAAEQGKLSNQINLGMFYLNGTGVAKDYSEAAKWYRKAAEQGNAKAQNRLGTFYVDGKGVSRDYVEAKKWYRKAAEQGNANAQSNLAALYQNGQGGPKDSTKAKKWYRKAAEQGHEYAKKRLNALNNNSDDLVKTAIGIIATAAVIDQALKIGQNDSTENNNYSTENKQSIKSPHGLFFISKWGISQIRNVDEKHESGNYEIESIVIKHSSSQFGKGEVSSVGWWIPSYQQFYTQRLMKPLSNSQCEWWSDASFSYSYKPVTLNISGNSINAFKASNEYIKNRMPKATCDSYRFYTESCERIRCNTWVEPKTNKYMARSKKDALLIFKNIIH